MYNHVVKNVIEPNKDIKVKLAWLKETIANGAKEILELEDQITGSR